MNTNSSTTHYQLNQPGSGSQRDYAVLRKRVSTFCWSLIAVLSVAIISFVALTACYVHLVRGI